MDTDAALRKRQGDPTGTNAEFERGTVSGKLRNEVNDGVDNGWRCHVCVPLVEASGYVLSKVILGHRSTHSLTQTATGRGSIFRMTTMHDRAVPFLPHDFTGLLMVWPGPVRGAIPLT